MTTSLTFVPFSNVVNASEEFQESTEDDDIGQSLDYFEDNYIGRGRRRNRDNHVFPFRSKQWHMKLASIYEPISDWRHILVAQVTTRVWKVLFYTLNYFLLFQIICQCIMAFESEWWKNKIAEDIYAT